MEKFTKIFIIGESTLILLIIFILFIFPSYLSTTDHLNNYLNKNISSSNITKYFYSVGGYYYSNTDTIEIISENNTLQHYISLKHELCHREQNYEKRLYVGSKWLFINELECNVKELSGIYDYLKRNKEN